MPAGLFVAGGYWDTDSAQVDRMRRAVDDDVPGNALNKALASVQRKGFELGGHQLTRVPSGYDKEHPRADLLRYKTLTAHREYGAPDWLPTPKAKAEITKAWKAISPARRLARHPRRPRLTAALPRQCELGTAVIWSHSRAATDIESESRKSARSRHSAAR